MTKEKAEMSQAKELFEVLMRENAQMLLAYLRASVHDNGAVEDIFQEVMVVAWRRMPDFDRTRPFGRWLRGIAKNLILVHYRNADKLPVAMDENTLDWMDNRFAQIQTRKGDTFSEKLTLLRECIELLSTENKKTIEARYLEQCSLEEIVLKLGLALQTVKKRLYRSKSQLAECLESKILALEE